MDRIRRALVAAAALLLTGCAISRPDFVYSRSPHIASSAVPTSLNVNWDLGLPMVEVFIDGRGPWRFALDTGSDTYVVDQRVADELNLDRVDLPQWKGLKGLLGAGSKEEFRQAARFREFRCGPLVERDAGALVFDFSAIAKASAARFDGILPATAFRNVLLTFDAAGKTATVVAGELPPPDDEDVLSLEIDPYPFVTMDVEGRRFAVILDSGSTLGFTLPYSAEASLRYRSPPVDAGRTRSIAGDDDVREGRLDGTIAFGRYRALDPVISFTADEFPTAGFALFREFRITFDLSHSRVRFERAVLDTKETVRVRLAGADGTREITFPVVTLVE